MPTYRRAVRRARRPTSTQEHQMTIAFIDLAAQQRRIRDKLDARIAAVLDAGNYIMGPEVSKLELQLAASCGARFALGCANCPNALPLAQLAPGATPSPASGVSGTRWAGHRV